MRLSTSLHKNVMEATVGGILNKFVMRSRRITLFFEDIIGEYILDCERCGHGQDLGKLAERWAELTFQQLVPDPIKKLPKYRIISRLGGKSWCNLGIVDDIHFNEKDDIVCVTTKNEAITRIIGENDFMAGFFNGTVNALYNSQSRIVDCLQSRESCRYQFELEHKPITVEGKDKSLYDRLNYLKPIKGFTLNDAFRRGILQLKEDNKIYFRGKGITITENTIFHLVGNADTRLDKIPQISYDFFREIVEFNSTDEQKLILLKNLLQVMGWGIMKIIIRDNSEIFIEIKNPPYGLHPEKDNWRVLINVIQGYLWLIDKDFSIRDVKEGPKDLGLTYGI